MALMSAPAANHSFASATTCSRPAVLVPRSHSAASSSINSADSALRASGRSIGQADCPARLGGDQAHGTSAFRPV